MDKKSNVNPLPHKSEKRLPKRSSQRSVVPASCQRKRLGGRTIEAPLAKVARVTTTLTVDTAKRKQKSVPSSMRKTESKKKRKEKILALQRPRRNTTEVTKPNDKKSDSLKTKKTRSGKVRQEQRTPSKATAGKVNKLKNNKRTKSDKNKTQFRKGNRQKKKLQTMQPTNKRQGQNLRQNVPTAEDQTRFSKTKKTTENTSNVVPYLMINTSLPHLVSNICCVDQNTMWIGKMAFGSVMKVKYNSSKTLTVIKELKCDFHDFCYDRKNDQILYTDRTNYSVMSISSKYEVKKFKCVKPLKPTCITVSSDNFIFVGLVDKFSYMKIFVGLLGENSYQESSNSEIIKLSTNGSVVMRIPSFQGEHAHFSFPHRIAIHPMNNDIVVAARSEQKGENLLIFDSKGQLQSKTSVSSVQFNPCGLVFSPAGNIVCCNEQYGEIYIFNAKGKLMKSIAPYSIGIRRKPWSLAWDTHGHLIIGTFSNPSLIIFADYFDD